MPADCRSTATPSAISRSSSPGMASSSCAGLAADPLGVPEVAGVVVGHAHLERVPRRHRLELGEELG